MGNSAGEGRITLEFQKHKNTDNDQLTEQVHGPSSRKLDLVVNLLARAICKSASTMEGMSMAPLSDVGYDNIYLLVKKGISIFYLVCIEKRGKLPISDIQTPHEHKSSVAKCFFHSYTSNCLTCGCCISDKWYS